MSAEKVITRFAPSPTGKFHIGSYRTAIFSYLFAKHNGGKFVLRIEDTDRARSEKQYEENILDAMKWLGLEYDIFIRQSENLKRHTEVLEKMIAGGDAYVSKEMGRDREGNETGEMKEIVRFKNPNIDISFEDMIRGIITINTADLGDFVIAKNLKEPLYHVAVVIDDADEDVTHVIRGEEHISNTPRQILIQRAIGAIQPIYAHLPLVLGEDRQKLSKRKGAVPVTEYRDRGYLPEAIFNAAAMIGWNPGTEQEVFTKKELVQLFDLSKVQKGGATLNPEKLNWFNKEHLKKLSDTEFLVQAKKFVPQDVIDKSNFEAILKKLISVLRERISYFGEINNLFAQGELDYFFDAPKLVPEKICFKEESKEETKINLKKISEKLQNISEIDWNKHVIEKAVLEIIGEHKKGPFLHPLRYALSGKEKSPDPFTIAEVIGKGESTLRVMIAIKFLT